MRALLLILLLTFGCTASDRADVTVYGASSLTDVMRELGTSYERQEGKRVAFVFGGSQALRLQIEHGANADVFATADERHLRDLTQSQLVTEHWPLARNEIVAIVPTDSKVRSIEALADVERIVVGADSVPAGAYTREALQRLDGGDAIARRIVSRENNVRMVRSKVEIGVADAAFVYRTDASSSDRVRVVELPPEARVSALYGVGLVREHSADSRGFVEFLRAAEAARVFERHGFGGVP